VRALKEHQSLALMTETLGTGKSMAAAEAWDAVLLLGETSVWK
jgi:type II secretory pathway predicted ATPase ExeA